MCGIPQKYSSMCKEISLPYISPISSAIVLAFGLSRLTERNCMPACLLFEERKTEMEGSAEVTAVGFRFA